MRTVRKWIAAALLAAWPWPAAALAAAPASPPLQLEEKIPLGPVEGRIDHLAVDLKRQRLFIAELGNDTVGVVDLKGHRVLRTLTGFAEPQGVAYVASTDTVYVANGDDGSVIVLRGEDFSRIGRIDLGDDADNVRWDPVRNRVYVGYGSGGLAVIDPATMTKVASIALNGHPESFRIAPSGSRIYVNVPRAREIAVVDRAAGRQVASWSGDGAFANFPMQIDGERHRVLSAFRMPARLKAYAEDNGTVLENVSLCGDADDLFVDSKRERLYVICGAGVVDVFSLDASALKPIAAVRTSAGSRTGYFVPEWDRLYVAVRASGDESAALWTFRPEP